MSDESVHAALRSDAALVVIEAPAGCGKTHQGADYACDLATGAPKSRTLILTHTHAACSVFAERTRGFGSRVEIRTIDSVVARIATTYHAGLGLPADPMLWVRQRGELGHAELTVKVARLLKRYPMIANALAGRYPVVICDEHQDSSSDQHATVMALHDQGARVRLFADPMQKIFSDKRLAGSSHPATWDELLAKADTADALSNPHRWTSGCPQLGAWTLEAREALKSGGQVDLRQRPSSVKVVFAENEAQRNLDYRLSRDDRKPIDDFEKGQKSLLILTRHNDTARAFRSFFNRRIPLWEGYTRTALEKLIDVIEGERNPSLVANALVSFIGDVARGFSPTSFGNRFETEVRAGCIKAAKGKPAAIQQLARLVLEEPDHHGVAKMLRCLSELRRTDRNFREIELDCHQEFWDAIRLGEFETPQIGMAEIRNRRTYSRPKPPERAISTIHKAKGLECGSVVLMPCDLKTFPDKPDARCLLYVALSRAKRELMLVVSRQNPSPLLIF